MFDQPIRAWVVDCGSYMFDSKQVCELKEKSRLELRSSVNRNNRWTTEHGYPMNKNGVSYRLRCDGLKWYRHRSSRESVDYSKYILTPFDVVQRTDQVHMKVRETSVRRREWRQRSFCVFILFGGLTPRMHARFHCFISVAIPGQTNPADMVRHDALPPGGDWSWKWWKTSPRMEGGM